MFFFISSILPQDQQEVEGEFSPALSSRSRRTCRGKSPEPLWLTINYVNDVNDDDDDHDDNEHVEEGHHHVDEDDQREQRICNGDFHL